MVAAKFKRMKNRPIANRGMPPCVASVLSRKEPLTYQLRFQLAEVFSYTSLEFLREVLAPRVEIDGKTRHKNVEACFHVARKKRQTEGPASPGPGSPVSTVCTELARTASRSARPGWGTPETLKRSQSRRCGGYSAKARSPGPLACHHPQTRSG